MSSSKVELIRIKVYYYGTSIEGSFRGKCQDNNMNESGFGEFWVTKQALYFRLYLTHEPFRIPVNKIFKVGTGHFHAGKFSLAPIMKFFWNKNDEVLVSGFSMPKKMKEALRLDRKLRKVIKAL